MLACSPLHIMLAYLHLRTLTLAYFALGCFRSSSVCVCKCECRSVSVQRIFRKNPSQCFREERRRTDGKKKEKTYLKKNMFALQMKAQMGFVALAAAILAEKPTPCIVKQARCARQSQGQKAGALHRRRNSRSCKYPPGLSSKWKELQHLPVTLAQRFRPLLLAEVHGIECQNEAPRYCRIL